jgi:hypothetical protein
MFLAVGIVDPSVQNKVSQDPILTPPLLPPVVAIRPRPVITPLITPGIPSVHINLRLQAKLQRIRRLAAAEMEKKAAADASEEPDTNNEINLLDHRPSEFGSMSQLNYTNPPFTLKSQRAQSDVHLRIKRLDLSRLKASEPIPHNASQYKNNNINERQFCCVSDGMTRKVQPIRNSFSMLQCRSSDPNWQRDGCQEPTQLKDRLGSLQPLCEQGQTDYSLMPFREETEDPFISVHTEDEINLTENSRCSGNVENLQTDSSKSSETQERTQEKSQSILKNGVVTLHNQNADNKELDIESIISYESSSNNVFVKEPPNHTHDNEKVQDFFIRQEQTFVPECFSFNGNHNTSTDV